MNIDTLIIGYVPLADTTGKRAPQIRNDKYFREFLAEFDLGTVHFCDMDSWQTKITEINPLFAVVLGGDWCAQQVKDFKGNVMLYVSYAPSQIFSKKVEIEEKKAEQRKLFAEVAGLVQKAREKGEEEIAAMRKFSAMSYKEMYDLIKKGLISENKELHDSAWDLLFGEGERHMNLVWMRINVLADVWEAADGKGREELMCMSMDQHVSNGLARKLDVFTDEDGQQYHQYMFCNFFGQDINYIRRIPFGEKKQDKYAYSATLERYETPANFMRVTLEANELKKQKDEHFNSEAEKIVRVLTLWKEKPELSKKELGVVPWEEGDSDEEPLTGRELTSMKNFLEKHDKAALDTLFPCEREKQP